MQQRSVDRVNQMLDVAAELLDEGGYDALSTRTVAARTGLPIGSIYRFFGDKRSMVDALTRRNLDRFLERVSGELTDVLGAAEHWDPVVDVVVEEYLHMKRTVPGFAVLDFGDNRQVADALAVIFAERIGLTDDAALRRVLLTAVEAADGLLKSHHADPLMVEETKILLRAYLGQSLAPPVGDR